MQQHPSQPSELEPWEIGVIHQEALAYWKDHRFRWSGVEDLEQQALISWWQQRVRYDPSRGASKETFLKTVVRSAFKDVLKAELADYRLAARTAISTDQSQFAWLFSADFADDAERRLSMERALRKLSPRQRAVFDGLRAGYQMKALAEVLGVHRDTLYEDRKRIQKAFKEEGLDFAP